MQTKNAADSRYLSLRKRGRHEYVWDSRGVVQRTGLRVLCDGQGSDVEEGAEDRTAVSELQIIEG